MYGRTCPQGSNGQGCTGAGIDGLRGNRGHPVSMPHLFIDRVRLPNSPSAHQSPFGEHGAVLIIDRSINAECAHTARIGHPDSGYIFFPEKSFTSGVIIMSTCSLRRLGSPDQLRAINVCYLNELLLFHRNFFEKHGRELPLDDGKNQSDHDEMANTDVGQMALDGGFNRVAPKSAPEKTKTLFSIPSGTTWSQVAIRMLDGHTASVAVGRLHRVLTFAQMGMVNRKNGAPSVQWELLRLFAVGHGVLTWRSSGADRKNQKRRELLAKHLQRFFRIPTDPFLSSGNGWRTRFSIDESP